MRPTLTNRKLSLSQNKFYILIIIIITNIIINNIIKRIMIMMTIVHLLGRAFTLASWPSGNKLLSSALNLNDDDDIGIHDDDDSLTWDLLSKLGNLVLPPERVMFAASSPRTFNIFAHSDHAPWKHPSTFFLPFFWMFLLAELARTQFCWARG